MAISSKPPVNEIGLVANTGWDPLRPGVISWGSFVQDTEYVPELLWPNSVLVYDQMRNDSQVSALVRGSINPVLRYKWLLDPNGARDDLVENLAKDLNIDIKGKEPRPRGRQKKRFSLKSHMKMALEIPIEYGHCFFEQAGEVGDDGLWHLRKLAERLPSTIGDIAVAEDGGLVYIKQNISSSRAPLGQQPEIPVDRLVAYTWDKEGGNWFGRSLLRPLYRDWLIKDRLLRIDVVNHERAGGVPWVESPPGATDADVQKHAELAQRFRVGEAAGGALPQGAKLNLARIGGGTDIQASIRSRDEAMARHFLMMFMMLGQTQTGSRALGSEFIDWFALGQEAIADWFRDIFNMHVIEDWVDWNYGENEEQVPLLMYERDETNQSLVVADLVALLDAGALIADDELEDYLRDKYNMPNKAADAPGATEIKKKELEPPPAPTAPPGATTPKTSTGKPVSAERGSDGPKEQTVPSVPEDRPTSREEELVDA